MGDETRIDSAAETGHQAADQSATLRVRWEGAQFVWHSLAHVNRQFCRGLIGCDDIELSIIPYEPNQFSEGEDFRFHQLAQQFFAPLSGPADAHIRHLFPPYFAPPAEGRFVLMQPWEYGYLPTAWVESIQQQVSEVWCYSHYVRDVYLASGMPEACLQVIPLGVDTQVFNSNAPPYVFTTEPGAKALASGCGDRFLFLFVGGTLHRKGIDILLDAYCKAFSALDEVCLVIKDTGTQTTYRNHNERERILSLVEDAMRPPIIYLDSDLSEYQLAGLYAACDCLVQPYRGEGFCLPALEAMACGRPAIVTAGGPTDDFIDEVVGWRVKAERQPFKTNQVDDWQCVGEPWMLEVSPDDLGRVMRYAYGHREEVAKRGLAAQMRVQDHWTWRHSCQAAIRRLQTLKEQAAATSPATSITRNIGKPESPQPPSVNHKAAPPSIVGELAGSEFAGSEPVAGARSVSLDSIRSEPSGLNPAGLDRSNLDARRPDASPRSSGEPTGKGRRQALRSGDQNSGAPQERVRPTVSLCMIVRNEERVLDECLQSAKTWVDEIVVVDTGSEDRTIAIARAHGVRLFHYAWCDDFSAARNESLKHATGDWIFWMDADDTLPAAVGEQLRNLIATAEDRVTGYLMQVHFPSAPGETGVTIVDHVKLFRNLPELRFEGRIHEQILGAIYQAGGRVERTDLYVVHSGYDYSPQGQARKRERDLLLLEKDLQDRPDHPFVLFNLGMTAYHLKEYGKAISYLERCLALSKPRESTVRKVYAMLAGCHLEQGDKARAVGRIEQGLKLFPHDPELLFRAGIVYREMGDLAAAERSYVRLLTARETGHIDSIDISMTSFKAHHNLALVYEDMQRFAESESQWRAALKSNPGFVPAWLGLGELYLRLRRFDDARAVINILTEHDPTAAQRLQQRLMSLAHSPLPGAATSFS